MSYPFANNRVVANIAAGVFMRGVISGDNVESGGVYTQSTSARSVYLEDLYAKGKSTKNFGLLVKPLGVQFIVLSDNERFKVSDEAFVTVKCEDLGAFGDVWKVSHTL
jgi:hypothetical protein